MFEQGFIPGFFNFITMRAFDGISGNTNWVGVIGTAFAIFWIYVRITDKKKTGSSGHHYRIE